MTIGPIPHQCMTQKFIRQNGRKFTGVSRVSSDGDFFVIDDYYYEISKSTISAGPLWDFTSVTFEDTGETVYPFRTKNDHGQPMLGLSASPVQSL